MDCSVEPTRHAGVWNITTTDFFFPLVEDPYLQGRIGCCNVLSDLYAMGVTDCDRCPPVFPQPKPQFLFVSPLSHPPPRPFPLTPQTSMLMLVAASLDMPADIRLTCTGHMMRGFNDVAVAAGSKAPPPLLHNTTVYPFRFSTHNRARHPSHPLPHRLSAAKPSTTPGPSSAALRRPS
jgi:hypothetical protein